MSRRMQRVWLGCALLAILGIAAERGEAHKMITSKYTFNEDVFPVVRDRCGRCHVTGGVAPMSLMTYKDAFPWAESIRAELVAAHMPPWNAEEGFGTFKNAHTISARELDVLLTWSTGGTPPGDPERAPPEITLKNEWALGPPDLVLPMPSEFTLAADKMEDSYELTLPTRTTEPRWIRAVDLLPGTPSIVRSASISLKPAAPPDATATMAGETVLAVWVPGQDPVPVGDGVAFRLPAGADLLVRVRYKKTWMFEGKALTDRSSIGLYFDQAALAQELLSLPLASNAVPADDPKRRVAFSRVIDNDVEALAFRPEQAPANLGVGVDAVLPDGTRTPMIRLTTRPEWFRRYWFERPLALPRGTRIEVVVSEDLAVTDQPAPASSPSSAGAALRFAIDYIPARAKRTAP